MITKAVFVAYNKYFIPLKNKNNNERIDPSIRYR